MLVAVSGDLFTLKLFLTAIDEGQVGRAVAREHIAVSAATKRIQDLEQLAGMKLFDRNAKGVVPSQAGLVFARQGPYRVVRCRVYILLIVDGRRNMQTLVARRLLGA